MGNLHMSIGEGFHNIILNISRDHLTSINIDKAISVFTDGLGMTREMAIKVIKGEVVLDTDIETQTVVVKEDEVDDWWESEFVPIMQNKIKNLVEDFASTHMTLLNILKSFITNQKNNTIDIEVSINDYIQEIISFPSPAYPEIENGKKLIGRLINIYGLTEFGIDPERFFSLAKSDNRLVVAHNDKWGITKLSDMKMELMLIINYITNFNYSNAISYINGGKVGILDEVTKRANDRIALATRDLDVPVHLSGDDDISFETTYDAYWIDRFGNAYGATGNKGLMLHIEMADAICTAQYPDRDTNLIEGSIIDSSIKLEEEGYVKISDNWVLYCAQKPEIENNSIVYVLNKPITVEQKTTISKIMKFGKKVSSFKCGYRFENIRLRDFENMDEYAISKLFFL